jgi:hypothetical protein
VPVQPQATAAPAQPQAAAPRPKAAASRTIVRALVQLLIDKGVISMDELAAHIRALSTDEPSQGD